MRLFPDTIGAALQHSIAPATSQISTSENATQRFARALRQRLVFDLSFDLISQDEAFAIRDVLIASAGATRLFHWFHWISFPWFWVPVAVGDGVTQDFTLPFIAIEGSPALYSGNGTDVALSGGTSLNSDGTLVVHATSAPASGLRLWTALVGRRRFTVRCADDAPPFPRLIDPDGFYSFTTKLVQIK